MSVAVVEGGRLDQDVSRAIKHQAGTMPSRERGYRALPLSAARVTGAGHLTRRVNIHAARISMLWRSSVGATRDGVTAALSEAERLACASRAMPSIGAGSGGMSEDPALVVIEETLTPKLRGDRGAVCPLSSTTAPQFALITSPTSSQEPNPTLP